MERRRLWVYTMTDMANSGLSELTPLIHGRAKNTVADATKIAGSYLNHSWRLSHSSTQRCEATVPDVSIEKAQIYDFDGIFSLPRRADVMLTRAKSDDKKLLVNSQHPSTDNPFPNNHSLTYALTGRDQVASGYFTKPHFNEGEEFQVYPNPATRLIYLNREMDVAIYNTSGKRMVFYRKVNQIDFSSHAQATYFLRTNEGQRRNMIIE